jgi:hypothetical protein
MADIFQTGTDKAKGLAFIALFYLVDPFNGSFVHDIAADPIIGIGWIDDDPPAFKDIHDLLDESLLGILLVNIDKHYFLLPDTLCETSGGRNSEPQPATSSAVSNIEGWFRFAQSFFKLTVRLGHLTLSIDPEALEERLSKKSSRRAEYIYLEPNWLLFEGMNIFNEDFGPLMPSLSLTLNAEP